MNNRDVLRILMVADVSPLQKSGGSARAIREQTLGLLRRGHEVALLCRHPGGDLPMTGRIGGAPIRHYPVNRTRPLTYAITSIAGARSSFKADFTDSAWDVVVFHQPFSSVGVHSVLSRRQPCLYYFYSPAGEEYKSRAERPETGRRPRLANWIAGSLTRIERRALGRADRIIVLSDFSRRMLHAVHRTASARVVVIPGGVDLDHFHPSMERTVLREELGIPRDAHLLLTIRDLEPRMGLENLLTALTDLNREQPYFCVIGGSGPLRPFLEARAYQLGVGHRVRFAGHVPEEQLPRYYQAADLFVLPTTSHEGFGLVTVEALACGTPVAATPVGATPEILSALDNRLLAEDATAHSLAATIRRTMGFADDESFRRRCRLHAESRYSWEKHFDALEAELFRALDRGEHHGGSTRQPAAEVGGSAG